MESSSNRAPDGLSLSTFGWAVSNQSSYSNVNSAIRSLIHTPEALIQCPCQSGSSSPIIVAVIASVETSISTRLNCPSGRHFLRR